MSGRHRPSPAVGEALASIRPIRACLPAWEIIAQGIAERHSIVVRYHDRDRLVCAHALGWKNSRAKALVFQTGLIGQDPWDQDTGWRSLFVDEVENPALTDAPWRSGPNYTPCSSGIDLVVLAVPVGQSLGR